MATNDIKFNVKNGLSVGASGFEVINTAGEWVGASGPGQSPYGATGAQGVHGASGITGDVGIDGASGATGTNGTQGATGIEGYQGATGSQGSQGDNGSDGYQGIDGQQGYQGATGAAGIDGASGAQGEQGVTGQQGATGGFGGYLPNTYVFDPARIGNNLYYPNSDYFSISDNDAGYYNALGTQNINTGNGYMFSFTFDYWSDTGNSVGIANINTDLNDILGGNDENSIAYRQNGDVYYAGSYVNDFSSYSNGDTIDVAVDTDNHLIWFRVNGGYWNNNVSNNPATGVGGLSVDNSVFASGPVFQAVGIYGNSGPAQFTINDNAQYGVPSGYTFLRRGVTANTGYQGASGVTGDQGETGATGAQGFSGNGDLIAGYIAADLFSITPDPTVTFNAPANSTTLAFVGTNGGGDGDLYVNGFNTGVYQENSGAHLWEYIYFSYQQNNTAVTGGVASATNFSENHDTTRWITMVDSLVGTSSPPTWVNDWEDQNSYDTTVSFSGISVNDGEVAVLMSGAELYGQEIVSITGSLGLTWVKRSAYTVESNPDQDTYPVTETQEIWYAINNTGNNVYGSVVIEYASEFDDQAAIITTWSGVNLTTPFYGSATPGRSTQGYTGASGATGYTGATGPAGARYHTTSTDNLDFGTYFTTSVYAVDDNLNYSAGQTIIITDLAHAGQHFHATVNTWDAVTKELNFTVTDYVGTISSTSWEINLSAAEGQMGASGATGIFGASGITGPRGTQGTKANSTGSTGLDGEAGIDGASGADGAQGDWGNVGATGIIGDDGAQGIQGASGVQGATGSQGYQGDDGASGVQGIDGQQGYQGATGSQGVQGEDGDQGYTGIDGATGYTGATGAQGGDGSSTAVQFDTSYGHYGPHQSISSGSNGADTILSGTVGYVESAITTAEMSPYINSGLTMFGVRLDADIPATTNRIGLGTSGIDVNNALGMYDDQSQGFQQDGTVWINGIQTDSLAINWGVGDLVEVAVNYNTGYFWARVNGGAWSKGGDPVAGTNGSGFLLAQPYSYPAVSTLDGAVFELITTPQYDVPSGYTYLGNGAPTNTGYTGSTGADGEQGPVGNAGYDADQLTYGTPRGAWDIGTYYYVDDIVVTIAPSPDSHRCIVPNIGNDPDTTSGYWVTTAYAGASGASGIDGASGVTGQDGATGAAGYDQLYGGATGPAGATGIIGTDAATGPTGSTGATGATGIAGIDGASGADGYQGASGATGAGGLQFKATADGNFSISAVGTSQLAVPFATDPDTNATFYNYSVGQSIIMAKDINNYMVGDITATDGTYIDFLVTESVGSATGVSGWVINLNGAVGWIGASGATGISGASGITGQAGIDGASGASGVQGSTGAQGIDGASGATGITGATGAQGIDGASGPQGIDGDVGIDGASGPQGATGQIGHDGATGYSLATGSTGLSGTSQQTVDIFASNIVGTAKYLVQGVDGAVNVQATEVILTQNASGVYITEYATLRTGSKVMDVTAASSGGVVSLKVTPTSSPTNVSWVRESVQGRIGGTTVDDDGSNVFSSRSHSDFLAIPIGKAYVYPTQYFIDLIDFSTLASAHASITVDSAGVGPQNPAIGTVDTWDGATLVLTITSGNFTSRDDLDKITYGY